MIEQAVRMKLRWNYRGVLSVEDVYDLGVGDLKEMYVALKKKVKEVDGDEFLASLESVDNLFDKMNQLRFDIVKHVMQVKVNEAKAKEEEVARKEYKQSLLSIKAEKQVEDLRNLSEAELDAKIAEL